MDSGSFSLEFHSDIPASGPSASNYSIKEVFKQGSVFETGRNYLHTHEDELFIALKEMPAADFKY